MKRKAQGNSEKEATKDDICTFDNKITANTEASKIVRKGNLNLAP